jgi:hypothetical protein
MPYAPEGVTGIEEEEEEDYDDDEERMRIP